MSDGGRRSQNQLELPVRRRKLCDLFCECSTMDSVVASEAIDPGSTPGIRTSQCKRLDWLRGLDTGRFGRFTDETTWR